MSPTSFKDSVSTNIVLAMSSIVPTAALMLAWVTDHWLVAEHWTARLSMLLVAASITGIYGFWTVRRLLRGHSAARNYLDVLSQTDTTDLNSMQLAVDGLSPNGAWMTVFERVRDRITEQDERIAELEMSKVALEVRARRTASQYDRIVSVLDNLDSPVLAVDEYDEVVLANPIATKLFDMTVDPDEKQMLSDLVHCQQLVDLLTDTRRRKTVQQRTCDLEIKNADGESRWFRATARQLIVDDDDQAREVSQRQGVAAVLTDIGSHKEVQKRHAQFVSSVSHEMKTPLAGIKAHVELLADGDAEDPETREAFLEVIVSQTDRLQRLVENLLNIARIEAGVVQVSKAKQSLNDLLAEAFEVVKHLAENKQINLVSDLSSMYLGVHVDRDMMLQAAINLLSNAIKYTPNGRQVTLRSRLVGSSLEFEVEDEGVGLSAEDQKRVFDKFFRVNKDKGMAAGTGLGLPLAKHIVEDVHQGQLSLKSEPGVGSTFSVKLPSAGNIH